LKKKAVETKAALQATERALESDHSESMLTDSVEIIGGKIRIDGMKLLAETEKEERDRENERKKEEARKVAEEKAAEEDLLRIASGDERAGSSLSIVRGELDAMDIEDDAAATPSAAAANNDRPEMSDGAATAIDLTVGPSSSSAKTKKKKKSKK